MLSASVIEKHVVHEKCCGQELYGFPMSGPSAVAVVGKSRLPQYGLAWRELYNLVRRNRNLATSHPHTHRICDFSPPGHSPNRRWRC